MQKWRSLHRLFMPPRHVAVLGGGLTGLTAAYHLSRRFPSSLISLYETSDRYEAWGQILTFILLTHVIGSEAGFAAHAYKSETQRVTKHKLFLNQDQER
jgi:predicted NAD/FAD-binding protein